MKSKAWENSLYHSANRNIWNGRSLGLLINLTPPYYRGYYARNITSAYMYLSSYIPQLLDTVRKWSWIIRTKPHFSVKIYLKCNLKSSIYAWIVKSNRIFLQTFVFCEADKILIEFRKSLLSTFLNNYGNIYQF